MSQKLIEIISRIWDRNDMPDDLKYLKENDVSAEALIGLVQDTPEFAKRQIPLLNALGIYFYSNKCKDMVLPFLDKAYDMDPGNTKTKHNLVMVLRAFGEKEKAKKYES